MSFICGMCSKAQDAGVSPVLLITEQRRVNYPARSKDKKVFDPGGSGVETVSTVNACPKCARTTEEENS